MPTYIPVIGMEVHVELKTKSKMFCSCAIAAELDEPNTRICEICLGHPGTLPVPNKQAIAWTVAIGRALGCSIREVSKFDRKHYFYPDLPKGYQISQYDEPIAEHGRMALSFFPGDNLRDEAEIGITRAHLEEDTAKLYHASANETYADFNRAGVPLVEIVTDPDFKSALEAKTYCQELRAIMRTLGVSSADMEKGQMRCEANISLQEAGRFEIENGAVKPLQDYALNNKVEVKNINSFRAVEKAIEYEIARQRALLEANESWPQQTRGWDEDKEETVLQRIKENAADYRYFPEPDIPPFHPRAFADLPLPELPQDKRRRFMEEFGFSYADAKLLSDDAQWAGFAEETMSELLGWLEDLPETKNVANEMREQKKRALARSAGGFLTSKLAGALSAKSMDLRVLKVSPENFAELIALAFSNRVNSSNAQKILDLMLDSGVDMDPSHIMEEKGWGQIQDEGAIGAAADDIIRKFGDQVAQFKNGKDPVIKFLIGMVMKATEGSADPIIVEKILREKLR